MWVNGAVTVVKAGHFCIASEARASSAFFMLLKTAERGLGGGSLGRSWREKL